MNLDIKEVKLEIYIPEEHIEIIRDSQATIGACRIDEYSHVVSWQSTKNGSAVFHRTGTGCDPGYQRKTSL